MAVDQERLIPGLLVLAQSLSSGLPIEVRLTELCRTTVELLGCDRSSIFLREGRYYEAKVNYGNPPDIARRFSRFKVSPRDPLVARVMQTRSFVVVNDAQQSPLMDPRTAKRARIQSIVVAPLLDDTGEPAGFITAEYNERPGAFSDAMTTLVLGFAKLAELAAVADRRNRARQQAEAALVESEERHRALSDLISDYGYAFRVAPDGSMQGEWVTESFSRVFGFTLDEVVARGGWQTMVHPEDMTIAQRHIATLLSGQRDVCEFRFVKRDGEARWLRDYARPVWDEHADRVVRIYGASQDITERKQAEERLRQSVREMTLLNQLGRLISRSLSLEHVGHAAIDGIAETLAPDLILVYIREDGGLRLLAVGPRDSRFELESMPAHRVGECLCGAAALHGETIYSFDISTDPRCTWEECKQAGIRSFAALPLKSADRVIGILGVASRTPRDFAEQATFLEALAAEISTALRDSLLLEDATRRAAELQQEVVERQRAEKQLRESEEKFLKAFQSSPDAIMITRAAGGRIIEINEGFTRLSGYARDEALGRTTRELNLWADLGDREQYLSRLRQATPVRDLEVAFRVKSGDVRIGLLSGELIELQGHACILGLIRDITERKRAEQERERLQAELRRRETLSAMGSLVAGVAHEARNPLFGISATLDAFEARFGKQTESAQYLTVLRGEVNRLNDLTRDLLDYGRPANPTFVTGSIAAVIDAAVAACAPLARDANVQVAVTTPDGIAPLAMDAGRLPQVFQNLLQNAIQHSPRGGLVMVETAEVRDRDQVWIECAVRDSGPGFREEDLPRRIFDPFFSRRRGGTGLGLSIVERIVGDHRGTVSASNRPEGRGVVTVRLPAAPPHPRPAYP